MAEAYKFQSASSYSGYEAYSRDVTIPHTVQSTSSSCFGREVYVGGATALHTTVDVELAEVVMTVVIRFNSTTYYDIN
jgi:hypothetical protein